MGKLYYVHYHPCPKLEKRVILITENRNKFCHTHSCDSAPEEVSCAVTSGERRPLVKATIVRAKEVRDMDAGPSHSRPVVFACLLLGLFFASLGMVAG